MGFIRRYHARLREAAGATARSEVREMSESLADQFDSVREVRTDLAGAVEELDGARMEGDATVVAAAQAKVDGLRAKVATEEEILRLRRRHALRAYPKEFDFLRNV